MARDFFSLPLEIRQQIFREVYRPWYLRYTQTHDSLPLSTSDEEFETIRTQTIPGQPLLDKLPTIGPLLVCKSFYAIANDIFQASFTGYVYIVGKLIWKEVHKSYTGTMARAKDLVMAEEDLWAFISLRFAQKMFTLERVTFLMGFRTIHVVHYELRIGQPCIKALGRRQIDGTVRWLKDLTFETLFDDLRGYASDPYRLRRMWTLQGIFVIWRLLLYAVTDAEEVEHSRDMVLIDFCMNAHDQVIIKNVLLHLHA